MLKPTRSLFRSLEEVRHLHTQASRTDAGPFITITPIWNDRCRDMIFGGFVVHGYPDSGGKGANVFEGAWSKLAKGVDDSEKVK